MLMQNMLLILCIIAVATYVVAWIEIRSFLTLVRVHVVATYVVAWIEISAAMISSMIVSWSPLM